MTNHARGRRSVKREKLPPLIESYLLVLESRRGPELLDTILSPDVQLALWPTREPIIGLHAVRESIAQRRSLQGASIHLIRMADFGNCVKADFNLMPAIASGDHRIFQVIGMYEVRDKQITEIVEAWLAPREPVEPVEPEPVDA